MLSEDFHIIQYKDGCLLGVNGKCEALLVPRGATDSAMITYLLDTIRATFAISGAREEEHEQLRRMEDETNQTAVLHPTCRRLPPVSAHLPPCVRLL